MGSFKDVVGHKDIINYISNAVAMDQVSHAYILNGERGAGKKMLALLFAMTLLCEKKARDLVMNAIPVSRRRAATIPISSASRMRSRILSGWMTSECR